MRYDYSFWLQLLVIKYYPTIEQMEGIDWKFNSEGIVHGSILLEITYRLKNEYIQN